MLDSANLLSNDIDMPLSVVLLYNQNKKQVNYQSTSYSTLLEAYRSTHNAFYLKIVVNRIFELHSPIYRWAGNICFLQNNNITGLLSQSNESLVSEVFVALSELLCSKVGLTNADIAIVNASASSPSIFNNTNSSVGSNQTNFWNNNSRAPGPTGGSNMLFLSPDISKGFGSS